MDIDISSYRRYLEETYIFADRSPAGWRTVDEYLSDNLASNSEDEKRIKKAESKALAKEKAESKPKTKPDFYRPRYQPYYHPQARFPTPYQLPSSSTMTRYALPWETPTPSGRSFNQPDHARQLMSCFGCGRVSHWRKNCPSTNEKIKVKYINDDLDYEFNYKNVEFETL